MGKVLVLFDSQTQNTAKMAALVAEGAAAVEGAEVRLRHIDQASGDDLLWCDGIALGSPTHMGQMSWKMKRFWDECGVWGRLDGRIAVTFSSEGGHAGGSQLCCLSLTLVLMNFGCLVLGITDYAAYCYTLHYGATAVREPRAPGDQAACRLLGRRLALAVRAGHVDLREPGEPGPLMHAKPADWPW